jgi:RNA polymerase sigma-70 factor (ECF subfamily)
MHNWDAESDERILAAAARDVDAFAAFYRRWERPVLAYFRRRTGDAELAADLTAEVFAAVLGACARWRPGGAPAASWLFAIAQRTLGRSRRRGLVEDRARRRLAMAPLELGDDDLRRIDELGDASMLMLLDTLPAEQRDAVRARVLEEQSYEEIAARLRCSPAVVRKRVSRGLAKMRHQIGEETP